MVLKRGPPPSCLVWRFHSNTKEDAMAKKAKKAKAKKTKKARKKK
jgi:hypothetical protein